jgi:hypothetical protein
VTRPVALACSSTGNCAISVRQSGSGNEFDGSYLAAERNGTWKVGMGSVPSGLACSPGYCIAPLIYAPNSVSIERGGTWTVRKIPGLAPGGLPLLVSCAPGGTCTIAGFETGLRGDPLFSITDRNGTWGKPQIIRIINTRFGYNPTALSCPAAGNCLLGGFTGTNVPVTETQHNGIWAQPQTIPGMAAINAGHQANVSALYCTAPGQCVAGGLGAVPPGDALSQGWLATEANGRWGKAFVVPGISTLEKPGQGPSELYAFACWDTAQCVAGGYYYTHDPFTTQYPFVITEH